MNSTEDSEVNDISFRHDFDPVTIKCEILDDEIHFPIDDFSNVSEQNSNNMDIKINDDDISMPEFKLVKIKNDIILDYESSDDEELTENWSMDAVLVKEEENVMTSNIGQHFIDDKTPGVKQMETQTQFPGCSTIPESSVSSCATSSCTMTLREKKQLPKKKSLKRLSSYRMRKRKKKVTSTEEEEEYFTCEFCAMQFRMKKNYDLHLKPNPDSGNLNLPCLYCNINFEDVNILEEHIKNIHKACKLCDIIFTSDKDYNKHNNLHKSGSITFFLCTCGVEFKDKQLFTIHVEMLHKNKYNFSQPLKRKIKEMSYEKMVCKKSILCPYCHINFSDENILMNHKRTVHNVRKCILCLYHYVYYAKNSESIGYDPDSVDFICEKCEMKKDIKSDVENELEIVESNHSSYHIDESISQNESIKIENESENIDSPIENIDESINDDIKTETVDIKFPIAIKYKCHICSLKFTNEKDLKRHLKLPDLKNLNLPCIYCNKICKNGKKLEKHLKKVHHACKICDITFKNKKEISLHYNDHKLGLIIFFVCACGDEFKDFVTFHIHVKFNHKNDKQYINPIKNSIINIAYEYINCIGKKMCPYCNKCYNCDVDLEVHKNDVHNVYKCESCNNHFIISAEEKSSVQCKTCRECESELSSSTDSEWVHESSGETSEG